MSLTDTQRHWLRGCAVATAASRSDVNVAMPHLRGKWPPTKAILRSLEFSFMRHSFHSLRPALPMRQPSPTSGRGVSSLAEKEDPPPCPGTGRVKTGRECSSLPSSAQPCASSVNLILSVVLKCRNEEGPSDFAAPGNNRSEQAFFLGTSASSETRFLLRWHRRLRTYS